MANKWVTHDHSNYPPGGPLSSSYLADADEFNQNYQDVCDAVGARYIRGVKCGNKNSTTTTCEIWLQADGGAKDVCDAGWIALIYHGASNVWETTVSVSGSDCYIVFGDGELENPAASGISDYSSSTFIGALHIVLFPKKMMLPKDWVITTSGANGCLSTAEIYHESEPLSTFIADVKDRVDVALDGVGNLNAGVVDSTSIDGLSAVKLDNPVNLLAGGSLEHYGDRHDLLFGVEITADSSAVEYEIEETDTDGSERAQRVDAGGSNQGILLDLSPNFADKILAGKDVAASFRVKTDTANSLEVGFLEDSTTYSGTTPTIAPGTWTTVTVTKEVGSATTQVRAFVRANQACTFYVARAQANVGNKCFGFSIGPYEDAARILMDTTQDNLLYDGGFEGRTLPTGTTDPPDGWFAVGSPVFTTEPTGGVTPEGSGNKVCRAELDANEGLGQYLGLVTAGGDGTCVNENILVGLVRGSKVSASVDLMIDTTSASDTITLVLGDYDGTTYDEEEFPVKPILNEMRRYTVYKEITSDAKQVYFKILNKQAAKQHLVVDNAMLHVGEFPLMFKPSSGWREMRWDFGYDGTASDGDYMSAEGVGGGGVIADAPEYPVPGAAGAYLMLKAAARCLTAPDTDVTWTLSVDSTNYTEISVEIKGSEYYKEGANHVTDYTDTDHECTTYIKAPVYNSGGAASDCVNTIFSVWGYYYAS